MVVVGEPGPVGRPEVLDPRRIHDLADDRPDGQRKGRRPRFEDHDRQVDVDREAGRRQDGLEGGVGMGPRPQPVRMTPAAEERGGGRQDRGRVPARADRERRVDDDRSRVVAGDEEHVAALLESSGGGRLGQVPGEGHEICIDHRDELFVIHPRMVARSACRLPFPD